MTTTSKQVFILASVVALAATVGVGLFAPLGTPVVQLLATDAPVASARASVAVHSPAAVLAPVALASVPERQLASAQIRQVLPSVQYAQKDWRQFSPDKLTVEAVPGCPVEFEVQSVKMGGPRGDMLVWRGAAPGIPGSSFVGVGYSDGWVGSQVIPGAAAQFISVSGNRASVMAASPGKCGNTDITQSAMEVSASTTTEHGYQGLVAGVNIVDVLFVYEDTLETQIITESDLGFKTATEVSDWITAKMTAFLEECNQYLVNSGIDNLQWRSVGVYKIPSLGAPSETLGGVVNEAITSSSIVSLIETTGADQIVVLPMYKHYGGFLGAAGGETGFSAMTIFPGFGLILAHEMGHNFGCNHDRKTEIDSGYAAAQGIDMSNNAYNFGYRATWQGTDYGSIMSYAFESLTYFSNPSLKVSSSLLKAGTAEMLPLGIAAGQIGAADDARWMREHAAAWSAKNSPPSIPVIVTQPVGVSRVVGQNLVLSVTATGGTCTYQWRKDGQNITGATNPSFSITDVVLTDAGSYTVVVTNGVGAITSNAASVTVTNTPVTPPITPPSGGGGGGGGSMSLLYIAALPALVGLRRIFRRK
jgi:hypothetical protein